MHNYKEFCFVYVFLLTSYFLYYVMHKLLLQSRIVICLFGTCVVIVGTEFAVVKCAGNSTNKRSHQTLFKYPAVE